jgi:hypothetical protein
MSDPRWEQPSWEDRGEAFIPSIVGEDGPEAYLPLVHTDHSQSVRIWHEMAERVGAVAPKPLRILGLKPQTFVLVVSIAAMTLLCAWLGWIFGGLS